MAIDNSKELYVDIDLSTQSIKEQTKIVVNSFNEINVAIANISKQLHTLSVNVGNIFANMRNQATQTAKSFNKSFGIFQKTGNLTKPIQRVARQKGNERVFKQAQRNLITETELGNTQYYNTREQKLILDYQRKQIDNQIKIKNGLVNTKNETKNVKNETNKVSQSTSNWFKALSKIGLTVAGIKRLGQAIGELVKESGSWIENLNLFEVTFGENYQETLDWSIEFAENLGFAVNEMVKFTGLFKQLSTSIGIADETGDKLAETLTSIGTDKFNNVTLRSNAYRKLGEPTNVGCEQYKIAC